MLGESNSYRNCLTVATKVPKQQLRSILTFHKKRTVQPKVKMAVHACMLRVSDSL